MKRGLSPEFAKQLEDKGGLLNKFLEVVKKDSTLCLEIRNNAINVYYRGGSLFKIEDKKNGFEYAISFNKKYFMGNSHSDLPQIIKAENDVASEWIRKVPDLKNAMDLFFGKHPKNEREFQQLILRENNQGALGRSTDYFICDIEYDNREGARFDLIAVKWPSTPKDRKNAKYLRLAFIEKKYLDGALRSASTPAKMERPGISKHLRDMREYLKPSTVENLKKEMKEVVNLKKKLGLINIPDEIESFSNEKPEFILLLANHDPASKILIEELRKIDEKKLSDMPFDLKFAVSNFMGYGLFNECIYTLSEFKARFAKQIYSGPA